MKRRGFFVCFLAGLFLVATQPVFSQSEAKVWETMAFVNGQLQARGTTAAVVALARPDAAT